MRLAFLGLLACGQAFAQSPFVQLHWEASDDGIWTRSQMTTSQQNVHIRLVAVWGGTDAFGFGGTNLDAVIDSADMGDIATNLRRPAPFNVAVGNMTAIRQGNLIKLDNELDLDAPGAGQLWIPISQSNGVFGVPIDPVNPGVIFQFDLMLAAVGGTREIYSVHQLRSGANAMLWTQAGIGLPVLAPVFGIDVTYVPGPNCVALLASTTLLARRKRVGVSRE